jgi:2OG-Fe(II) oxygenase superfamily
MWRIDEDDARRQWASAQPFAHAIVDDAALDPAALLAVLEEEAVERYEGEIALFDASTPEPAAELAHVRDAFAEAYAPAFSRITGKSVTRVDMRAYAYRPGHYLLPHTDHQDGLARLLAYAYYLPSPEPPTGGELELYRCALAGGEITAVASGRVITPQANRLVVFDVGDASLHQVREVIDGLRLSLAGWFYA